MTTYFVSTTGNDTTGSGSQIAPYRTIVKGMSKTSSGDTVYIRGGTYPESLDTSAGVQIASGTSWSSATTISQFQSEQVIVQVPNNRHVCFISNSKCYIVFNGIIFDGSNQFHGEDWHILYDTFKMGSTSAGESTAAHHIRAINCTMRNAGGQGVLNVANCHHCEIINCSIHDNGSNDHDHGIYWGGANGLIDGCEIYRNYGQGVQIFNSNTNVTSFPPNNVVVRNNYIHNNAYKAGDGVIPPNIGRGTGIILSSHGNNQQAYNNIIVDNNGGIRVDWYNTGTLIYNNTVYRNTVTGPGATLAGIYIGTQSTGAVVRNNICFGNSLEITDLGVGTVKDHNLLTNPNFINAAGGDFHIPVGSPAVGYGVNLSSIFNYDYDGNGRQSSGAWDAGAYMYGGTAPPPPTPIDLTPPSVTITNPINGSTVSGVITLTVSVSDVP